MTKIAPVLAVIALGCTPAKPPRWEEGGAPLAIPAARWDRPGEDSIEIRTNGQVLEDGDLIYALDRVDRKSVV